MKFLLNAKAADFLPCREMEYPSARDGNANVFFSLDNEKAIS
jgi:hypothetical protein